MALSRRQFLARVGVLGAAAALFPGGWYRLTGARGQVREAGQVLAELARDTFNGLAAFVVPGPDEYSVAQGMTSPTPGAMAAKTTDFLIKAADFFVPFPDAYLRPIVAALREGSQGSLPPELFSGLDDLARQLDEGLEALFHNDNTIPLSLVFAMQLNFLATRVNPAAANGSFLSPFARLTFAEKVQAWELFERPDPDLVAAIDGALPEPQTETVSGVLRFAAGALVEFAAFGTYTEFGSYDLEKRALTGRPVGWTLSGYQHSVDGWDDFKGYWKGRKEADR
jgi:hypothetical protein